MSEQPIISQCLICGSSDAQTDNNDISILHVKCKRCGVFSIGTTARSLLSNLDQIQKTNLSGWIRENQKCKILREDLDRLQFLKTPSVSEKADKLLIWMAKDHPKPGTKIQLFEGPTMSRVLTFNNERAYISRAHTKQEVYAHCWAADDEEVVFIILAYLINEKKFIEDSGDGTYRLTPQGWSYLDSLTQGNPDSRIGFIAMWFEGSMNDAWEAIDKGIRNAGYEGLRIDQRHHNNKIDDEIIAGIRRSKFLVADFTGQRGGVYFEAGFAMGLGLPVIWLCRQSDLKETHFDTRQYNFIVWETDKLPELSTALKNRIEATIGHGPLFSAT